ncbi:transaldolase [Aerococcus urinaeequi]|uniref:transaldolase n=1 Tax=Aerococcus urinaeequi TaxID=51665 RepID=UPI00227DA88D|nr:transaldolase [Aerococcus urinaeequi]MCY7731055.1 transaldolase [Aerococcus urinaeequi]
MVKIFTDGANIDEMLNDLKSPTVTGVTTNPSLMKAAGITDYIEFANKVVTNIKNYPISFEVFSDDIQVMKQEAEKIASIADNIYVKIPVMNTKGESTSELIKELSGKGIKLNITAIFTLDQVEEVVNNLQNGVPSIVSVFAGRIADTGVDPIPLMKKALSITSQKEGCELLWASTREILNIYQANDIGVDIVTVPPALLKKFDKLKDKDLYEYSLETVEGFVKDGKELGYSIL